MLQRSTSMPYWNPDRHMSKMLYAPWALYVKTLHQTPAGAPTTLPLWPLLGGPFRLLLHYQPHNSDTFTYFQRIQVKELAHSVHFRNNSCLAKCPNHSVPSGNPFGHFRIQLTTTNCESPHGTQICIRPLLSRHLTNTSVGLSSWKSQLLQMP